MGIDELRPFLEDHMVQWALLRFDFGEGVFKRQKILFLHINGELCPAVPRGKANELTAEVKQLLRGEGGKDPIHASLEIKRGEEATAEYVLERVVRYFNVDDNTDANPVAWLLKEYERQIKEASGSKGAQLCGEGEPPGRGRRIPGHQLAKLFTNGRDALKAVGEPLGPWNWVFVRPDAKSLELVDGGTDSIDGMRQCATVHNDAVLFGLLRMGFGEGRLRRTKYVFVQANGTKVSPVFRGRAGAARSAMQDAMAQFVVISVFLELSEPQDLQLQDVIDRVRRAAHIDDDVIDKDQAFKTAFSVEAFRKALAEDQAVAMLQEDAVKGKPPVPNSHLSVKEAVTLLRRTPDAPLNWALFGPNEEWIRCRKSTQVAPTGRSTQLIVPGGGYMGAHARARSSSPVPAHARHTTAVGLDDISETRSTAKARARSEYQATSNSSMASFKRRSTLESEVVAVGTDTPGSSGPGTPSAFAPLGSGSPESVSAVIGALEAAAKRQAPVATPKAATPAAAQTVATVAEPPSPELAAVPDQTTASTPPAATVQTLQDFINPGAASVSGASAMSMESSTVLAVANLPHNARSFAPPSRVRARIAGPLLKMSGSWLRSWQLRWFEVSSGSLMWWDCPEDAESGKEPKGMQELVDMKVRMVPESGSQFSLTTSMGKDKTYVFDANASIAVKNAGWGIDSMRRTITTSAADWIKALEQESIVRRREPAFSQRQP